jgi:hypothetical protein
VPEQRRRRAAADVVVVMAKRPIPGAVKTRLARTLGSEAACRLYRAFLRDLRARLHGGPWRLVWAVHPRGSDLSADVGAAVEVLTQRGGGLAARMRHCFADLFAAGAGRVVMLGADAPHVGAEVAAAALAALARRDLVLLPTRDGGYCLIGLRQPHDLFSGIVMGTAEVFRRTLRRARDLGLSVEVLPETFDVDEAGDLQELTAMIRRGDVQLQHTAAELNIQLKT